MTELEHLKKVAALALATIVEHGYVIEDNRPIMNMLDDYIANELPEELWGELDEMAKKIELNVKAAK